MVRKILMATMGLDIGGAETHIVELSRELVRRGYEVSVASNGGVYVPEIEAAGIRHHTVPLNRRNAVSMMKSFFMLRRIIKNEKPDIVHAHARIPAFLCSALSKSMGFPFVTTAHAIFETGGGLKYLSRWGLKTLAISDDIRDYLIRDYGVSPGNITVTVNGIDTEKFAPGAADDTLEAELDLGGHPVIVYVSRMDQAVCLVARQLIGIAADLAREIPGIRILAVGGGDSLKQLRERAEEVNRSAGYSLVTMTGPRTDIHRILASGDVFIGVSRSALEAMAAGRPVILAGGEGYGGLFAPEGLDDALRNNFTGRGAGLPAPEKLRDDIVRALDLEPAQRAELGAFGRRVVLEHYSVTKMAEDCIRVYEAVRKKRYSVVMSGYYGFNNSGDEAILHSIHRNIELSGLDASITVLSNDPADTNRRYGYNAVPRFHLLSVLRTIGRCDVLISGGGSLLQDRTSTRSILYYLFIIRTAEVMGKKIMLYANGIGPVIKKGNRRRVRKVVERASVVTLRDENSARELKEMGVKRTLQVTADPVFTLDSVPRDRALELLGESGVPTDKPFVGVSIRNWPDMEGFCEKTAALCDEIYEKYGRNIVFIVMQSPNDVSISRRVQRTMLSPSYILDGRYTAEELMGMIGAADFVLAMRLHTLIFAARMSVPPVGMVYDPKVAYYLETLSMPSLGRVEDFSLETALDVIRHVAKDRQRYSEILREKAAQLAQEAHRDEEYLTQLLCDG